MLVHKVTDKDSGITHAVIKSWLHTKATSNSFTFTISFDSNSFVERKNPWAAIRAFVEAFPALEGPLKRHQLIVKSHSATVQEIRDMQSVIGGDTRVTINDLLSDVEMDASEQLQDCHVSLQRGLGNALLGGNGPRHSCDCNKLVATLTSLKYVQS